MKTKLILLLVLTLATIHTSIAFQEKQDHKVLFEKAKYTMETKADLKEAINLFELLINTYPNEKEYVAKSLLYQGMCYEKLGNQEAVKKYQNLVENYPGQKNEVAIARERLSRLILIAEKVSKAPSVPIFTKIQIPVKLARGAQLSPDGKKLLFHGNKKGVTGMHIWTVPIEGGEPKQIIQSPLGDAFPSCSPDGKTMSIWRQEKTADGNRIKTSLCLISVGGDDLRVLVPDTDKLKSGPHSMCWSPDSKSIVYYCMEDGNIKTIPVDNGGPQVLAELNKGDQDLWITFSPDGKKILYTSNKKIWTISLNGEKPVEIITGLDTEPADLAWSPNGKK